MNQTQSEPFIELRGIGKKFGGVEALRDVDLKIHSGEVLALLGDNGAGKTTLVKVISGVYPLSSGKIVCRGKEVHITGPGVAHELGIETVFQDLAMVPNLGVTDNFYIGRELTIPIIPGFIEILRNNDMHDDARETLKKLNIHIPSLKMSVDSLSGGQRQAVAIARAIRWKANLVILDEPTAALAVPEQRKVLELTRSLADQGVAVVYITHNMSDVLEVSDRIAVMYRGTKAGELMTASTSQTEIVEMIMTGQERINAPEKESLPDNPSAVR